MSVPFVPCPFNSPLGTWFGERGSDLKTQISCCTPALVKMLCKYVRLSQRRAQRSAARRQASGEADRPDRVRPARNPC